MKLLDIYSRLKNDLKEVENKLAERVRSDHALLNETSLHLLKAGGKRIRPVFVLLSGEFGTYNLQKLSHVAVALELIHMATLVHDDVIDNASTRRGQLTVKSKWDNRVAMYTGDYIFAKALQEITQLENPRIHHILSKAIVEMCIGEIEQIRYFYNTKQTVRQYLLRIRRKTALLIAVSCQLGALAADADEHVARQLYSFGYNAGMAFQIRDDILDICGTERELGKPPGSDIRQGNITLPMIYALQDGELPQLQSEIERIQQLDGKTDVTMVLEAVRNSRGMHKAEQLANRYIDKSIEALNSLADIEARKNLTDIAYFIANRSY